MHLLWILLVVIFQIHKIHKVCKHILNPQNSTKIHKHIQTPTFINSSTSISEPIKPFDGLDHQYTPEEYLQNIDARVTFSLGLQPTNPFEYKYWHARRMALIQCSLTGTALDWYINLTWHI